MTSTQNLPRWMRAALIATAFMNVTGAFAFVPGIPSIRERLGFPLHSHPLYLWIVAEFIFLFGLAYGWCGLRGQAPRFFIALGAAGKLSFVTTLIAFFASGALSLPAALAGGGDLIFGIVFLLWLYQTRFASGRSPDSG